MYFLIRKSKKTLITKLNKVDQNKAIVETYNEKASSKTAAQQSNGVAARPKKTEKNTVEIMKEKKVIETSEILSLFKMYILMTFGRAHKYSLP